MRKKRAKQLKKLANAIGFNQPAEKRNQIYKRLKKFNKKSN